MKTLVIDLDHTICSPWDGEDQTGCRDLKYVNASPIQDMIKRMHEYRQAGFKISIHTSRNMRTFDGDVEAIRANSLPIIVEWLDRHDVPYDEIIVGKPWCGFDGFYVDDRAIRPSEFKSMTLEQIHAVLEKERSCD